MTSLIFCGRFESFHKTLSIVLWWPLVCRLADITDRYHLASASSNQKKFGGGANKIRSGCFSIPSTLLYLSSSVFVYYQLKFITYI